MSVPPTNLPYMRPVEGPTGPTSWQGLPPAENIGSRWMELGCNDFEPWVFSDGSMDATVPRHNIVGVVTNGLFAKRPANVVLVGDKGGVSEY